MCSQGYIDALKEKKYPIFVTLFCGLNIRPTLAFNTCSQAINMDSIAFWLLSLARYGLVKISIFKFSYFTVKTKNENQTATISTFNFYMLFFENIDFMLNFIVSYIQDKIIFISEVSVYETS